MNKEKILNLLKEIENELNKKEKIQLEPKNFKINSDGWTKKTDQNGVEYLENEKGDVWELLSNGEQLFTREAGMRETKKAGKRIPTDEEFDKLTKEDWNNIVYTGYRHMNGSFYNLDSSAYFWSSTEIGSDAFYLNLYFSYSAVDRLARTKPLGFSIRCVRD